MTERIMPPTKTMDVEYERWKTLTKGIKCVNGRCSRNPEGVNNNGRHSDESDSWVLHFRGFEYLRRSAMRIASFHFCYRSSVVSLVFPPSERSVPSTAGVTWKHSKTHTQTHTLTQPRADPSNQPLRCSFLFLGYFSFLSSFSSFSVTRSMSPEVVGGQARSWERTGGHI